MRCYKQIIRVIVYQTYGVREVTGRLLVRMHHVAELATAVIVVFFSISCSGSLSYYFPESAGVGTINCTAGPNPRCNATLNSAFLADRSWYITQDKAYYGSFSFLAGERGSWEQSVFC